MKYLLDTNMCIYLIKKKPASVFERFSRCQVGDIGISSITYSELAFGVANSQHSGQNELALQEFVAPLEIMDYPVGAAPLYGELRATLEKKGLLIGPLDMLIAAHTLFLDVVLVTNNVNEFSRVPQLRIENWVKHS